MKQTTRACRKLRRIRYRSVAEFYDKVKSDHLLQNFLTPVAGWLHVSALPLNPPARCMVPPPTVDHINRSG